VVGKVSIVNDAATMTLSILRICRLILSKVLVGVGLYVCIYRSDYACMYVSMCVCIVFLKKHVRWRPRNVFLETCLNRYLSYEYYWRKPHMCRLLIPIHAGYLDDRNLITQMKVGYPCQLRCEHAWISSLLTLVAYGGRHLKPYLLLSLSSLINSLASSANWLHGRLFNAMKTVLTSGLHATT
jgi:hypothetical protein